jgi:hypothetical protein
MLKEARMQVNIVLKCPPNNKNKVHFQMWVQGDISRFDSVIKAIALANKFVKSRVARIYYFIIFPLTSSRQDIARL